MHLRFYKLAMICLMIIAFSNSCSSGADPDDIIEDIFSVPLEYCLMIQNDINDMAMDVNAIVMNNLDTNKDTIDDEVVDCVTPVIYRTNSVIDSIVIDYGTSSCSSNGGKFKGKMIVLPLNSELTSFNVKLSGFYVSGLDATGEFAYTIVNRTAGRDFSISSSSLQFYYTGTDDVVYNFPVSSIESDYTYIRSEEDDIDYVDDIFTFTTSLELSDPNGSSMSLNSSTDLTYAYSCKNIIGGTADFILQDIGEGVANFGGGDTVNDCDGLVNVSAVGATISISL